MGAHFHKQYVYMKSATLENKIYKQLPGISILNIRNSAKLEKYKIKENERFPANLANITN